MYVCIHAIVECGKLYSDWQKQILCFIFVCIVCTYVCMYVCIVCIYVLTYVFMYECISHNIFILSTDDLNYANKTLSVCMNIYVCMYV